MMPDGWWDTTLGALADDARGFQIGPFGSELHASEYLAPIVRRRRTARWSPAVGTGDRRAGEGVPVVMPKDLVDGTVSTEGIARVPAAKAAELGKHRVRAGDVLFARRGELGRCAVMRGSEDGWICGTGCVRLRPRPSVEPRYLIQYLRWRPVVSWLQDHAVGQTMPSVNTKILGRVPVRLPPLPKQRAIARTLETVDAALRSARSVVERTRKLHDALLWELLGNAGEATAAGSPGPAPEAPPGWRMRTLGELCTFRSGRRYPASEWSEVGLPILRIQNLNGSREFKYFAGWAKPDWLVEPGELLFAWAGTRGVSFGPCLWDGPRGVLNQHIFRVRPREKLSTVWLYQVLRRLTRQIESKAHGFKASLVHVRKRDVTSQRVLVPPYGEQCRIAERSRQLAAHDRSERAVMERTLKLRRGLRDDIFEGRLRFPPGSSRL